MLLAQAFVEPASARAAIAGPDPAAALPQSEEEAEQVIRGIKSNLMRNFVQSIEWPESKFENERSPIYVAVVGRDPLGRTLDNAFRGKRQGERPIRVRRFRDVKSIDDCHVLFVPATEMKHLKEILATVKGKSVLLIGDSKDFAIKGGIINFYLESVKGSRGKESVKVKFEINPDQAKAEKIKISARILRLARLVKGKPKGEEEDERP